MTFAQLVACNQRRRVLRARRREWREKSRYVAVAILKTHTGHSEPGFIGLEINGPRGHAAFFGTPAMPDADRDDWVRYGPPYRPAPGV